MTPLALPRRPLSALLCAVLAALAVLLPARPARGDSIPELLLRYRSVDGRHDDLAYEVQREALDQLADLGSEAARRALRALFAESRGWDRRRAALILSALVRQGGPPEIDTAIEAAEGARDPALLAALPRILASARRADGLEHLRGPALAKATPAVKAQIARALGGLGDKAAVVSLLGVLRDEDPRVRSEALLALGLLKEEAALPQMAVFAKAADPRIREVAARALGMLGSPRALQHLIAVLADPEPRVVESAADGLGLLASPAAVTPLIDHLEVAAGKGALGPGPAGKEPAGRDSKGPDLRLVDALTRALERVTGMTLGDDADLWRAWWKEAKDRPAPESGRPAAPTTIEGPRYYGFAVRSSRVMFVVDVSRSMSWNGRLETAQKELQQVIERLHPRCRFGIVSFSDSADSWNEKLVPATPENVRKAVRYVERLVPINATNAYDGIRAALKDEDVDTVFLLSDGSPTAGAVIEPDAILAEVREMNRWRRVRIHTIALLKGEPPSGMGALEDPASAESFMKRLAAENDGQFRVVR